MLGIGQLISHGDQPLYGYNPSDSNENYFLKLATSR
jgi:hypothetical protein